nr:hypothetical protein [Stenotrophomonas maltophilia]
MFIALQVQADVSLKAIATAESAVLDGRTGSSIRGRLMSTEAMQ